MDRRYYNADKSTPETAQWSSDSLEPTKKTIPWNGSEKVPKTERSLVPHPKEFKGSMERH